MATQTYTATGNVTVPTTIPTDANTCIMLGSAASPIGYSEFNYQASKNADAQMYAELTDLIAKWCQASTTGLSTGTAALPYTSVTPRECLVRLQLMISAMLTQSTGG